MPEVTRETIVSDARQALDLAIEGRDAKAIELCQDFLQRIGEDKATPQDVRAIQVLAELDCIATALYRHFDVNGVLLYVGISLSIMSRTAAHEAQAPWFEQIDHIKLDWHKSRSSAALAEQHAIKTEKPLYNVIHNRGNGSDPEKRPSRAVRSSRSKRKNTE